MIYLTTILSAVIGYLMGCIPIGVIVGRVFGHTDIRKKGSGSTGTTNVLRTLGWVPSLLTFAGDCVKAVLGTLIGKWIGGEAGMLAAGLCAVLGHDFPVFMGFKGGKGIVASLGATIVICPPVAPWLVVIVIATVAVVRIMSLGSMLASVSYPILFWFLMPEGTNRPLYMGFAVVMMLLSFFCHRGNISRLLKGEENKLDFNRISKLSGKLRKK